MKKFLPVPGLLFTSISHLLGAYSNGACAPKNCPPKCPPKEPAPLNCDCPPPAGQINDCMPCIITPSAGPRVADGVDMFVTADFIYWTIRDDGLGYATSGWRKGSDPAKGSVKHPNFKFKPGFKVGLGVNLGHDGWDSVAEYTWLYTGNMNNSTSQTYATSTLAGTLNPTGLSLTAPISYASSTYNVHFNNIDWELGRNFFVSRYLKIRPHFGLKGAWYTKKFNVAYVADPDEVDANAYSVNQDLKFWGIGARTGFDTAWHFTKSFSIVGDVALSALWSQFKATRKDSSYNATDVDVATSVLLNTQNSFHSLKPVLELFLGLRWDTWFSDDDFHFGVEAGWEEQIWFNQNQFYGIYEQGSHGDMFAQGFTLKVRFDF